MALEMYFYEFVCMGIQDKNLHYITQLKAGWIRPTIKIFAMDFNGRINLVAPHFQF